MQFRLDRFYQLNRRALIWAALVGLIYLMRDFFAVIFITFLIVSFTLPVIDYLNQRTRLPRKLIIVALYLLILAALVGLTIYVVPRITAEASAVATELPAMKQKLLAAKAELIARYPAIKPVAEPLLDEAELSEMLSTLTGRVGPILIASGKKLFAVVSTALLSLLFSFLIVLDLAGLAAELRQLEHSRLHDFYTETAEPVVKFASVLARALRAQAMIATANTILTLIGFLILGLPKVALLSIVVFFFSFIPVLGVFISTAPAVIVAINYLGYGAAVGVIVLVTIIHIIEAYVLNPLIYGHHLKLNPVIVLVILFVGHHFFGLWGMLLGVPVAYYFITHVFRVGRMRMLAELVQPAPTASPPLDAKPPGGAAPGTPVS
jgi:predicted PurR-regulated permease PerM